MFVEIPASAKKMMAHLKNLKILNRGALVVLLVCFLLGVYASLIEPFRLKVSRWDVSTAKWTNSADLKIAILTDMHMMWPWMTPHHLQKVIEQTNRLRPDIVLLLGDYVATHPFGFQLDPQTALVPLKGLSATCGVYAILGNHDLHPPGPWPEALVHTGIPVLRNQAMRVNCEGRTFWVAGLDELWWAKADVKKTMDQITDGNPVIMMMHNPDSFPDIPQGVALSVAGHTHGGQVVLPLIGTVAAVVPSKYGNRYVYGHVNEQDKDLIVSSGLGMTGLPIRFLNPPEISFVILRDNRLGRDLFVPD